MIKTITHGINLVRHALRDVGVSAKRSSHWPTVEKHFREGHSTCAACGSKNRLNVHHILAFHIHPELELDTNNLITLCMSIKECHLRLGHGSDFRAYCPDIRRYAEQVNKKEKTIEEVGEIAKQSRLYI
jgi:hypothetical protein